MLKYSSSVEVVNKVGVRVSLEVVDDVHDFRDIGTSLLPGIANLTEAFPQGEDNDLSLWIAGMDVIDELDVRRGEVCG